MPRQTPSYRTKSFKAQHIFTDRQKPQEIFTSAVKNPQDHEKYHVLNFHGIGGQGKTALCEQFTQKLKQLRKANKPIGWAKLDFEVSEHRTTATALLTCRLQLAQHCKIPFPAFDTAFARYFAFTHQGQDIKNIHPDLFKQPNDILQDIEEVIGDVIDEIPGAGLFYKYFKKLSIATQVWWQQRGKAILNDIDELDQHKLLEKLPTYIGADLDTWLFDKKAQEKNEKRRLVILMDTYEALWRDQPTKTGDRGMHVDAWVRKLAEETPGILYVILGRDKLNWAEIEPEWNTDIKVHLLGGLSPKDANIFLQQVPIEEDEIRENIIDSSDGLPFYLDLQVDLYEEVKQKENRPKANLFGGKEQEILARFTDHLDNNTYRILQVVSHNRVIDANLAQLLADEFLGGKASINFKLLLKYSFWKQQDNSWYMHGLIREYLQDLQRKDEPELFKTIHEFLFKYYDTKLKSLEQVVDITQVHKRALAEAAYHLQQFAIIKLPDWACRRGQIFHRIYAWEQIKPLWEYAYEVAESQLGIDHLDTATVLGNLARLYSSQSKYLKAELFCKRSLKIREEKLGMNHPDVATALNNLAVLHVSQGEYIKAETLFVRSQQIYEKKFGTNHTWVATTLNNLAGLYQSQGKYNQAEALYERCLTIDEDTLGSEHPSVAQSLNNLAELYESKGKYKEAETLYERSLYILEEKLGKDHPHVATTLNNLGWLFTSQGKYINARALYERSLKIREDKLGGEHPDVAQSLNNLALLHDSLGQYKKAESLYRHSLRIREKKLGADHPDVAQTLNNLALHYESKNEYEKAKGLYERSLEIREDKLGKEHPDVAQSVNNLAGLYHSLGENSKAELLYKRSLTIREKTLGVNHPFVATSLNGLALLFESRDEYTKAMSLYKRAISIMETTFPDGHPNLEKCKSNFTNLKKHLDKK